MANISCSSCEDLRQTSPSFVLKGLTDDMCASLGNNTGLSPSDNHDRCDDLNNINDCLVGNMETEIDSYDVCDWKTFMKRFVPNVWTTLKAIICTLCGVWSNIACLNKKMSLITFNPTVKAFRGGGTGEAAVAYSTLSVGDLGTIKVYMDAAEDNTADQNPNGTYGSTPADRDYIAFLTWCADGQDLGGHHTVVRVSVRNNNQSEAYATNRAQHYSIEDVDHISMNQTGFCYLPKGGHLLVRSQCTQTSGGRFRVHQFSMVLVPVVNESVSC